MAEPQNLQPPQAESAAPRAQPTTWPDGWYVYENGLLKGPLSAAETFQYPHENSEGKPLLVSRKGFAQWYPLRDLAEVYKASGSVAELLAPPAQSPATALRPKVMAKKIEARATAPVGSGREVVSARVRQVATPAASQMTASTPSRAAVSKQAVKKAVLQEYFLARGRLRLGKMRSPVVGPLFGLPLSLGVYWAIWYAGCEMEMNSHMYGQMTSPQAARKARLCAVLALIPLVHMFMIYRLSKQLRAMEAQNKYQFVSPPLAAVLAICPPLAMGYVQHGLNRHWLLHAKHLVVKRRASAA